MKLGNIKFGKSTKFLTLLLTAILIATANAAIFYSLTMQPQVTVSLPVLKFDTAPDEPSGSDVQDAWCRLNAKSYPNATLTYEKAVYINNTDGSGSHTFKLVHTTITPTNGSASVGNWTSIKFLLYNSTGAYKGSLNYTVTGNDWILQPISGETSVFTVEASEVWWIRLETRSHEDATTSVETCKIEISVDVTE